ncbi:methyl-accepting chemotaxis protein [Parachlamydia acanthamoebae]|uniref:methyl-accepting chemotaxis protein n=1 Tax=Parachlamydia acanthamoebae TaxID=83552 RepID=UPI000AA6F348|nr:methyl-accepting chemotaxis protein [Parachlamydia acanthamoebae]
MKLLDDTRLAYYLERYTYSQKIMISFILCMICAFVLVIFLIIAQTKILSHIKPQIEGIRLSLQLEKLISQIYKHQDIVLNPLPSENKTTQLKMISDKISKSLLNLKNNIEETFDSNGISSNSKIISDFEQILFVWQDLHQANFDYPEDKSRFLHYELIKIIQTTLTDIYSWFGLYNNQDPGTHFFIEGTIEYLNKNQLTLNEINRFSRYLLKKNSPNLKQQAYFLGLMYELSTNLQNTRENAQKAMDRNGTILQQIQDPNWQKEWLIYQNNITNLIDKMHEGNSPLITAMAEQTLRKSWEFRQESLELIQRVLQIQVDTMQNRLISGIMWTFFGLSLVLAFYITRVIRRPISDLKKAAKELAEGNISVRVKTSNQDEVALICDAFNAMADFFENVINHAKQISSRIVHSAQVVNTISKDLETNITKQKDTISLILPHAKRISKSALEFALSLNEVNRVVSITSNLAISGVKDLSEMKSIMQQMEQESSNIVGKLSELQLLVGQITGIINTIVKIADQANLLSINAAIRASKTGPTGLGFSIIAKKIRELADQAAFFTLDIEKSIHQIVSEISQTALYVTEFSEHILAQVNGVTETSYQLTQLIENTRNQTQAFDLINQGMQQQAARAAQIHSEIYTLTNAAQASTQNVNRFYNEIQYLHHAISHLQAMTNKFISTRTK